jgi:hypothetical protein
MRLKSALSLACVVATFVACGGGGKATEQKAGSQSAVAAGDFGVPECDQYMKKYIACVDSKVPDAARGMLKQQLDQTRDAWKKAAGTPEGRAGLATGCKQAEAAAKQAMAAYGCQW